MRYAVAVTLFAGLLWLGGRSAAPAAAARSIELHFVALKTERADGMQEWFSFYDLGGATLTEAKWGKGTLDGERLATTRVPVTATYQLQAWFHGIGGVAIQGTVTIPDGDGTEEVRIVGRIPAEGAARIIGRKRTDGGTSFAVQATYTTAAQ